jgi:hypothetical protein
MAFADSNRVQVFSIAETIWGTTPNNGSTDKLTPIRFTKESLDYRIQNTSSGEVRDDRQVTDLVQVGAGVEGDVDFELSYGSFDELIAGALWSDWSSALAITAQTDIAAAATGNKFTSATASKFASVTVGQWIRTSGFATGANNGYFQVTAKNGGATEITVAGGTLAAEAAGAAVTIKGCTLRNGTTAKSFTLEKKFADIAQFVALRGCRVGAMKMQIQPNQILTGSFTFMGASGTRAGTSAVSTTPNAAGSTAVCNAVGNVVSIREGGAVSTVFFKSLDVSLNNNLRGQDAVGTLGHVGIGVGTCDITGNMSAYFENAALYDKFLAGTETSLSFRVQDADGNAYVFTLPRIKFESGRVTAGGRNADIMADLTYRAIRDATLGFTFQIDRIT